jgi:hypothetical protein
LITIVRSIATAATTTAAANPIPISESRVA